MVVSCSPPPGYWWLHVQINCCTVVQRNMSNKGVWIGAKTLPDKLKSSSLQGFIETISHYCCCLTGMGDHLVSILVWVTMMGINQRIDQATSANVSQFFLLPSGVAPSWCGFSFNCLILAGGLIFCGFLEDWRVCHSRLVGRGIQVLPNVLSVEILNSTP